MNNSIQDIGFAIVDYANKTITIKDGWKVQAEGDLELSTNKHIRLSSGKTPDPENPDTVFSIWLN